MQRLKDWPPNLDDMMVMVSTVSTDIGMITKSKTPLDSSNPVTGAFTTTAPPDALRAAMPMSVSEDMSGSLDTSAIGMAMDLSAKELIPRPIPTDETLDESPVPLPALYVLNNEGILSIWWIIYNESVRHKIPYPDLVAAGGPRPLEQKKEGSAAPTASPAMPAPSFSMTPPSQPTQPQSSPGPSFGAPSTPGFGGASALGRASPWGTSNAAATNSTPAFAKPAFGSSTPLGGAGGFGSVGGMGMNKPSIWGASQNQQSPQADSTSTFGKPSTPFGGNASAQSPFASFGNKDIEQKPAASPFGGGKPMSSFGGVGFGGTGNKPSPFASAGTKPAVSGEGSFGSTATLGSASSGSTVGQPSLFGSQSNSGFSFGKPSLPTSREETMQDDETPTKPAEEKKEGAGLFGLGGQGFQLGSTFQGDGSAKDDLPKPKNAGAGFFGGAFGNALGEAEKKSEPLIKQEPGTDEEPQLKDIPAAPVAAPSQPKQDLDPLSYKAKRFAGDIPPMDIPAEKSKEPDPLTYKAKRFAADVPPSDIPAEKSSEKPAPEAPFAGSPPIDLGQDKFSEPAASAEDDLPEGPPDEEDDEDWEEEGEEDDGEEGEEGEEEDEEDVEESDQGSPEVTDTKALAAFEARFGARSPDRQERQAESTTPATEKKASYTPAGFPKAPIAFSPPGKLEQSPRSPSPVRAVTAPLSKPTFGQPSQTSYTPQPQRIAVPHAKPVERPSAPSKPVEPEAGSLEDEEDARIQALLNSTPEPTKEMPHFLAHQNYIGDVEKAGIGGPIEKVYRDINSMIDTLGLNAHSLRGFVDGHTLLRHDSQRSRDDLGREDDWALDEVNDLTAMQHSLEDDLEAGKLEDVRNKLEDLREEEKEVNRFRAKTAELRKQLAKHTEPEQRAMRNAAPLPVESRAQQSELRQTVQRVQKLLGEVEGAMSVLRADLASLATTRKQANGPAKVPTVEAVTNTILKMTAMIEKKSGDIDVLEAQIRRLPGGIASLNLNEDYEDQLVASMTGSKLLSASSYSTPGRSGRTRMLANGGAPGLSGMLGGRFHTPPSSTSAGNRRSVLFSPEASLLARSTGSVNGSARKKMVDVTEEEVVAYHTRTERRKKVLGALKKGVESKGPRVVTLE